MEIGDVVPDIELPDQTGTTRKLSEIAAGKRVVLFFYPAAMTSGCTRETCHFRDLAAEFNKVDAVRVGISMDGVEKQKRFADKHTVDFPLLCDDGGAVAKAFGVKRPFDVLRVRRVTFVLDEDRRILKIVRSEMSTNLHADRALATLAESPRKTGGG